eukprot:CAMPEP_0197046638 /NCGR_PEP_ID=MMETSP1384-20130603/22331_1 /TAXON_ID=29189 /ORGANISM="Ammonia sp." /LENGTH=151 /DNA_ID=CAMNT_0042478471 /DNA_START=435 /DNA_END=890 /DNA_ORIENTATION=+
MAVSLTVFDASPSFLVSRVFVMVHGSLMGARFPLEWGSCYYYLGDPKQTRLRTTLYFIGLCTHFAYVFTQLTVGILFRVTGFYTMNTARLIFFILFEIGILPTQLMTFKDIHFILTQKISHDPQSNDTVLTDSERQRILVQHALSVDEDAI